MVAFRASFVAFSLLPVICTSTPIDPATTLSKRQSLARSPNYSGAALLSPPDSSAFTYATTQINVPSTIFVAAEGQPGDTQKSAAWVGFGGLQGSNGIVQTGCTFFNDGYDDLYTQCWYEYYPSPPVFYDGFSPSVDDTILLEITRTSDTTGHSKITNLSTGEMVEADFAAPDGHSNDGQDAEWIVENPGGAPNFVNFQVQFFEGCESTTTAGNTFGPGGGTYRLFNEWKDLGDGSGPSKWTDSILPSDSEVQVNWVSGYS